MWWNGQKQVIPSSWIDVLLPLYGNYGNVDRSISIRPSTRTTTCLALHVAVLREEHEEAGDGRGRRVVAGQQAVVKKCINGWVGFK